MHRTIRSLVALGALVALIGPAAAFGAPHAPLGGINIAGLGARSVPAEADRSIAIAKQMHAKIVRIDLPWSVLEPEGPALAPHALAFSDRLIDDAASAGIKVLATVASTPCWASSAPASVLARCATGNSDGAGSWPPKDPSTYAALLAALAARYGSKLTAIEVWNEPDQSNEDYFAGPEKVANYARLLRSAYPAVKQVDPAITVLGGSLVGSNGAFLKALYADGIKGYYDGLSVHYYNLTLASLRSIHETQTAHGDTKPLWLDEFGWTSCWPDRKIEQEQACVTKHVQALNLRNSIREMSRAPYVAAAMVYKLEDSRAESFGTLTGSGGRKPSFKGLREAFEKPFGGYSQVTLKLSRRGSHLLATGSGPVGDFLELEAFHGNALRYRALFTQDRFNRYSVALPAVLGTQHLRVRVFQYWTGPSRAVQKSV